MEPLPPAVHRRKKVTSHAVAQCLAGGSCSNCARWSVISNQSDFDPDQMCATDFVPFTLSSVPSRTRRIDGMSAIVPYSGEPHLEQNARRLPGDDSYSLINSRPVTIRKSSVRTDAFVAKDEPLACRHIEQLQ